MREIIYADNERKNYIHMIFANHTLNNCLSLMFLCVTISILKSIYVFDYSCHYYTVMKDSEYITDVLPLYLLITSCI